MDTNQALSILGNAAPDAAAATIPAPSNVAQNVPMTAEALSQQFRKAGAIAAPSFAERNVQAGVPLDIESGLPASVYFPAMMNRLKQDQLAYFQSKYGADKVRLADTGDVIVRVNDQTTGKPKDILANPKGMDVHDFYDLLTQAPEIAGGIVATLAKKPQPGLVPALGSLLRMAVGTEAAGFLKDEAVRAAQGLELRPGEAASSRAASAVIDYAMGGLFGLGVKIGTKLISPFSQKGPLQFDLNTAKKFFSERGLDLEGTTTPGQETGAQLLLRSESAAEKLPGSSLPFEEMARARMAAVKKMQHMALGLSPEPTAAELAAMGTAEEVGTEGLSAIRARIKPTEKLVEDLKTQAAKGATADIAAELGQTGVRGSVTAGTIPAINRPAIGEALRTKAIEERAAFRAEAATRYDKLFEHPLAREKNLPAGDMADRMKAVLDRMPKAERAVESIDYDQYGNPILKSEMGQEILKDFVPSGVLAKIQRLSSLKGQSFSLDELKQMRTEVENAIAEGEAIPGMKTHYLGQVQKALTDSIENGIQKLGNPELRTLWDEARGFYKTNAPRFQEATIARLFREEGQQSFMRGAEIVDQAVGSSDDWIAYRKFFGATSPEFQGLKEAVRTKLFADSLQLGSETINAKTFLGGLNKLVKNTPEIAKDVLGDAQVRRLSQMADLVGQAEGKLDVRKLDDLLASGDLNYVTFQRALNEQATLDKTYMNRIFKAANKGELQSDTIRPSEFVQRMSRNEYAEPKDVAQVMALLAGDPVLTRRIRQQTIQDILNRSSEVSQSVSVGQRMAGEGTALSAPKLLETLGIGKPQEMMYRTILGNEPFDTLLNTAKFLMPAQVTSKAFAAAGGLMVGSAVQQMLRGDIGYLEKYARNFLLATLYSSAPIRKWAANNVIGPQTSAALVNGVIASTPFIEDAVAQMGTAAATEMTAKIKRAIDSTVEKTEGPQLQLREDIRRNQAKQILGEK